MATAWMTYSWRDEQQDVDCVVQELEAARLTIRLDRFILDAGHRLWDQIASFIQDPERSDAWLLFATQASLTSEACREEYAYALDRALHSREATFPIVGLFQGPVDREVIPAGIRVRLYVSLTDPDWIERVVAAVEGRELAIARSQVPPYSIEVHPYSDLAHRHHAGSGPGGAGDGTAPLHRVWQHVLERRSLATDGGPPLADLPLRDLPLRGLAPPGLGCGPGPRDPGVHPQCAGTVRNSDSNREPTVTGTTSR